MNSKRKKLTKILARYSKSLIEKVSGHNVWLEPSANLNEVRSLIRSLSPKPICQRMVRIGGVADGGYVMPDDLEAIGVVVSPGVSNEVGFDLEMATRGMQIYMVDASVSGPPFEHPRFHFQKKFLNVFEDEDNTRLDTLCASIAKLNDGDRILQMDIEGAEYRVLLDASDDVLKSFRIILVEFHHLDRMVGAFPFKIIEATFQKLLRYHHIVHIHPNNVSGPINWGDIQIPPIMEFTFYRKDRAIIDEKSLIDFPHPLDRDNVEHLPSVTLPLCWRSNL